ncbi:hypothetical protein SAMN05216389_1442 [Oceanobacillus limi]|uniref:Uncharacterized protein n=1 Tax=Oceanobacillus limi TaxID=930131 RepID=A0A1I0HRQ7_9BACI|nr:hypothetical protein [Oceanobacillus limi]SET85848.1 hypothetical protein SAMN05216389_1442 [Oceanobacillus limi]
MFDLSDTWTKIASAVLIAAVTSFVTHKLAISKERRLQTEKHKLEILNKVYTPLYRAFIDKLMKDYGRPFGYLGVDTDLFTELNKIYKQNIFLIDPGLESRIWEIKEHFYQEQIRMDETGDRTPIKGDYDNRLIRYVFYQYNKMRRKLKLPYDKTYFKHHDLYEKFVTGSINYFRGRKALKELKEYRKEKEKETN